ncbi:MAG: 4Fe-4S dicluster domain-containing protein [Candidatus Lokiarchaeota archaeon]|nr:4Fe-4S dicluster domain-containing protein [Candidatus Lokiarchaeota archaeon]
MNNTTNFREIKTFKYFVTNSKLHNLNSKLHNLNTMGKKKRKSSKKFSNKIQNIKNNYKKQFPHLVRRLCIKCGECGRNICPVGVIEFIPTKYPRFDLLKCTSCFKCIEICQYDAIIPKEARLKSLLM